MKILYFIPRYDTAAMGNRIHAEVIDVWRQHGVAAEVVTLTAGLRQRVCEEQEGILVHRLPISSGVFLKLTNRTIGLALPYPYLAGALTHYRQFLQTRQYDLVHVETAFPLGVVAALMPRTLHPPLAVTLPGADIMAEPEFDYGYGRFGTVRALLPWVFKRAVVLRADSPQIRDLAIRRGADPEKVVTIPYNITSDSYPSAATDLEKVRASCRAEVVARHGLHPAQPLIVSLSRLHPFKGINYLIDAVSFIQCAGMNPQVLIIGPNRHTPRFGDYQVYLQQYAQDLGVAHAMLLVGAVDHALTSMYLAAADVVVVPSVAESFNRVTVEAAAVATPVVVTCTTGVSVYVSTYQAGLVVEPRSGVALATAVTQLLTDQQLWQTCSTNGPELAAHFRSTAIATALLQLYRSYVPDLASTSSL